MRWGGSSAFVADAKAESKGNALLDMLVKKGVITKEEEIQVRTDWEKEMAAQIERQDKTRVANWIDEMKWYGDGRLRYECFDNADQSNKNDRTRFRYCSRLGVDFKYVDWAKLGLRLASGGGEPVSGNQSMDNPFNREEIRIDPAYVTSPPAVSPRVPPRPRRKALRPISATRPGNPAGVALRASTSTTSIYSTRAARTASTCSACRPTPCSSSEVTHAK
jgi:hypothetical protein